MAASPGVSVHVADFANHNEVHGALGAVVTPLLWPSARAGLIGAAVNRALDQR